MNERASPSPYIRGEALVGAGRTGITASSTTVGGACGVTEAVNVMLTISVEAALGPPAAARSLRHRLPGWAHDWPGIFFGSRATKLPGAPWCDFNPTSISAGLNLFGLHSPPLAASSARVSEPDVLLTATRERLIPPGG